MMKLTADYFSVHQLTAHLTISFQVHFIANDSNDSNDGNDV